MALPPTAEVVAAARARWTDTFPAAELDAAFAGFQRTVSRVAETADWDLWADQFTPDALYIEHAFGVLRGREEIRQWVTATMTAFPGSHMTGYPALWHIADPATGRVICEVDNPMRDPGDGTHLTATNITILTYAGGGLWSCEEDIYNPMEFGAMAYSWCEKARALGTLDEAAGDWMNTIGTAFARRRKG